MTTTGNKRNLVTAARQWQDRPADERFWILEDMFRKCSQYKAQSATKTLALNQCEVVATEDNNLVLLGRKGAAEFEHYSFSQFANLCEAPASYLRKLPAPVAAECLNYGLHNLTGEQTLMFRQNGGLHLRCVTSDKYARIWDAEVVEMALALEENRGWRTPPARPCGLENVPVRKATQDDVLKVSAHASLGVKVGDDISPAGLYASDHDCFIFQVNEDIAIDGGNGEQLYRGVFWSNSEVGDARFRGTMFLYESICGNHIVWGAQQLTEISIRHTGHARQAFGEAMASITGRMHSQASIDEQRIYTAKQKQIAASKDEIVELVFRKGFLSKTEAEQSYVLAERYEDKHGNNPRSYWGYAAGVTRLSQNKYADDRVRMDRAAGKILELAF